ncbi:MAG: TrkA family potassium uptake protein [bacterium]|nr:TrkA family potassium uptake protein [bacterium]MCX7917040.1 TrkA family potassium uptake protein [bacterium]MDW8164563.1 TrkA family potassium uptake protein [Candidatus Omnitrophota bacterium]
MYIIIVGCGKVGTYLAKLLDENNNVVVIDKEEKNLEKLTDFNGLTILGDALDIEVLKMAGIEKADAIAVMTNNDNVNIIVGQVSKKMFNVPKVIIRISDPNKEKICKLFDIEIINTTSLTASLVNDGLTKKLVYPYILENKELTLVEIEGKELKGKKIEEINTNGLLNIFAIIRNGKGIIPEKNMKIEENDIIIGIVEKTNLNKFRKFIKP